MREDKMEPNTFYINPDDALLIKAAPELLEALEFVLNGHKAETGISFNRDAWDAWEVIARSAIAKARGKE